MIGDSTEPAAQWKDNSQGEYDLRFEWGLNGVEILAPICDAIVIVDVLSFSTCVDIVTESGSDVFPYRWKDASAGMYARSQKARLASFIRSHGGDYSLSPNSLLTLPRGSRIVLPSPNGSALSLSTGDTATFAGCLRNAAALGDYLRGRADTQTIGVIAAGERWDDESLRPAIEDLIGAGAILNGLSGTRSPESETAIAAFYRFEAELRAAVQSCSSGRELIGRGFMADVELASSLNCSYSIPELIEARFTNVARPISV